ncbi:MAG: phospholipase D family protein [Geminicoccaceae bacterium]|jgi:cardiolipin synthase C
MPAISGNGAVSEAKVARTGTEMDDTALTTTTPIPAPAGSRTAVSLVSDNLVAFALRAAGARAAIRTLDLQYYIWNEDVTGRLLAWEVLQAADRGVRVRLLLDDLYVRRTERALAALAQHPRIEVRLYNPFQLRSWGALGNAVEFLFAGYRLNHRMHNKTWIVDRQLAIGGGRNVGDEYFDAASQFNFRDLDLAVTGRSAHQTGALFDLYWNSFRVRPIGEIAAVRRSEGELDELRHRLDSAATSAPCAAYRERLNVSPELSALLEDGCVTLPADSVRVVADPPEKGRARRGSAPDVLDAVRNTVDAARREVLLISPYFVPGRRALRSFTTLTRRGIRVAVLTNSLAATDVLAVHGGYARHRRRLLRAGIELHELKRGGQEGQSLFGSSGGASLHTKAFVVDGELIFVGSFNLDPRSAYLNTEMGTFARHPVLGDMLRQEYARLADPARSWTVRLERGRLTWSDRVEGGQGGVLHGEPDTTLTRRVLARVLGWLPIEPQL